MILVRIAAPVAQDHVRSDTRLERLEPSLELGTLVGKEAILERGQIDRRARRVGENVRGGCARLVARWPVALSTAQCTSRRTPRSIQPRIVAPAPISMSSE